MSKAIHRHCIPRTCRLISIAVMVLAMSESIAQSHADHQTPEPDNSNDAHAQHPIQQQEQHDHEGTTTSPIVAEVPTTSGTPMEDHGGHADPAAPLAMTTGNDQIDANTLRDPHAFSNGYQLGTGPYAIDSPHLHMADEMNFAGFRLDRLEQVLREGEDTTVLDAQLWYGGSYNRLVVKTEAEFKDGALQDSALEVLWSHAIGDFWDTQLGLATDNSDGPSRTWLAAGIEGIAPYWFDVEATVYLGESGRTALKLTAEYDLWLSQRVIIQPRVEMNFYGKQDSERGLGSGLSDTAAGLRLLYQINRQLIPYAGIEQHRLYGKTASLNRLESGADETSWVVGVRFWF